MKDAYTKEELQKFGNHIDVPEGACARQMNLYALSGWVIFIPDSDKEVKKTLLSLSKRVFEGIN